MIRRLNLNGLAVTLVHQPDARDAAALIQVKAGSHDEPDRWPGLAHLLEHLLFTGSQRWPDRDRLMSWIQANGGRVNATTLARRSAYFFEITADRFEDGLARLHVMLCAPLFETAAIKQEMAVIDAEYRLLQHHVPAQAEAALFSLVAEPQTFHRFQIGSADAFGANVVALQQALRDFHQHFYVASNLQLWLQGPQSLDDLAHLAQRFAETLPQGQVQLTIPPLQLLPEMKPHAMLSEGVAQYWHSWIVDAQWSDNVTLLREFLLDDAPGGLMASLRQRGIASEIELKWLYQSDKQLWLVAIFTTEQPDRLSESVQHALQAIGETCEEQQMHYLQLAQQRFNALSPLEQLRQRVLGFAPAEPKRFHAFIAALQAAPSATLFCSNAVYSNKELGESVKTQGFELSLAPRETAPQRQSAVTAFAFYPLKTELICSPLPTAAVTLLHLASDKAATLILRPEFFSNLSAESGEACAKRLRPLFATLRHAGGGGEWEEAQGVWQLTLRLPDNQKLADWALEQVADALADNRSGSDPQQPESIAIRELLKRLPQHLTSASSPTCWRAVLCGGSEALHHVIARRLATFSLPVNPLLRSAPLSSHSGVSRIAHPGRDNALLLFIPLDQRHPLAALRALAQIYEPRFFQRLRVEQQIGYVVSSRYLRSADHDGVLFALQSPNLSVGRLLQHCKRFLRSLDNEIATLDIDVLKTQLRADESNAALTALRREQGLHDMTQTSIDALTLDDLQQLHTRLTNQRRRWRVLFTAGR